MTQKSRRLPARSRCLGASGSCWKPGGSEKIVARDHSVVQRRSPTLCPERKHRGLWSPYSKKRSCGRVSMSDVRMLMTLISRIVMKSRFTANHTSFGAKIYGTQLAFDFVRGTTHSQWVSRYSPRIYGGIRRVKFMFKSCSQGELCEVQVLGRARGIFIYVCVSRSSVRRRSGWFRSAGSGSAA